MRRGESQGRWNSRNPLCTLRKIQYFTYSTVQRTAIRSPCLRLPGKQKWFPIQFGKFLHVYMHRIRSGTKKIPFRPKLGLSAREIGSTIASELSAFKVGRRLIRAFTQLRRRHYFSQITLLLLSPTLPAHTITKNL